MSEKTKKFFKLIGKIAGVSGLSLLAALTMIGLYASGAGVFFITVGVLNLVAEGVGIYALAKKWFKKSEE